MFWILKLTTEALIFRKEKNS